MKRLIFGFISGYAVSQYLVARQFALENPDDPAVIRQKEATENVKRSFVKLKSELKRVWDQSKFDLEFKDIINNIE